MKTGRLLKLVRPGVELHVYLYQEASEVRAAVYALGPGFAGQEPIHAVSGASEAIVERQARDWVEARFPKAALPRDPIA